MDITISMHTLKEKNRKKIKRYCRSVGEVNKKEKNWGVELGRGHKRYHHCTINQVNSKGFIS